MENLTESILASLLKESVKTVNGNFENLLEKEINIPSGIRSKASDSQKHLREFLEGQHIRDDSFPRVLSINDNEFLGGSFARHTKDKPLDDIDIYFPIDGHNLIYLQGGFRLPFTVVSDNVLSKNPLLTARWMEGSYISSQKLVNGFSSVLKSHYPKTSIKPNGQAISIQMTQGETVEHDGLGFDVVPCFRLNPDDKSSVPFYLIPDGVNGWIRTNPRLDTDMAERLNANNNKTYRKVVKLLKYWNREKIGKSISSYFIELAIAKAYQEKNLKSEKISRISEGVALGFWAVDNAVKEGSQTSLVPGSPSVRPGDITEIQKNKLSNATVTASQAWKAELEGKEDIAISKWEEILGKKFSE